MGLMVGTARMWSTAHWVNDLTAILSGEVRSVKYIMQNRITFFKYETLSDGGQICLKLQPADWHKGTARITMAACPEPLWLLSPHASHRS